MLQFSPQTKPISAMLFSVSCSAAALVLYALSSYIAHRFAILPILSLILLVLGVWFLYRFALISYRYEIRDGVLCIIRRLFGVEKTVYTLSLRTGIAIVSVGNPEKKPDTKPVRTHNFLASCTSDHPVTLYYCDGGKLCSVILEDNPAFFCAAETYFADTESIQ